MIPAKNNSLIHWFFHRYINRLVVKSFAAVNYNTVEVANDKAVLLIANHFSWWDGFIMYYINTRLFKKRFLVMILEETSRKVSFFKYVGGFSVSKNSKDVVASLDYAAGLLNDPQNLVLIFPQGKLYSNFSDNVIFEKGVFRIMQRAGKNFSLVFAATFIEHLQHKKPTANVYISNSDSEFATIGNLQQAYRQHYDAARQQQTQIVL
ncbi:hypothetical protein GCM10023149_45640 [Mucilaginibacter gynuensis]|uniref:Phospholipid/glycerol acyltransferase domain-containing protein n=1 Tax=Mucilaginibacter gynuensis TaxID=1302236 RepID=A0ABP8HAG2_9SPHI